MKISLKRTLALLLSLIMIFVSIPVVLVSAETTLKTWDIIEYGSYPQSEVTKTKLKNTLSELAGSTDNWTSYGYYSGTGSVDGKMTAKNYMKYTDVTYNGEKYRGVYFSSYRPDKSYYKSLTKPTYTETNSYYDYSYTVKYTYQQDNGYVIDTVYWFKFEPIEWRVLDPSKGLVFSETILDSQPFSNYVYSQNGEDLCFGNPEKTCLENNWENSSLRKWLNKDFINTAFSASEQSNIKTAKLPNSPILSTNYDEKYYCRDTEDSIFLLSLNDVINTDYGFSKVGNLSLRGDVDVAEDGTNSAKYHTRRATGTSYAKSQGLRVFDNGSSAWLLRTAGVFTSSVCGVNAYGDTENGFELFDSLDGNGIRPAFCFKSIEKALNKNTEEKVKITSDYVYVIPDTDVGSVISAVNGNSSIYHNGNKIQSGMVTTGMRLETVSDKNVLTKRYIVVLGDMNNDGQVTVVDARSVLRAAVKLDTLTGLSILCANVDFADDVSVADARAVLRVAVKLDKPALWFDNVK